jgi:hypothetical protein
MPDRYHLWIADAVHTLGFVLRLRQPPFPIVNDYHQQIEPDTSRPVATGHDTPRQVATEPSAGDDYISLRAARDIFVAGGRSVSERTLQRACGKGHIECKKITTAEGEKWFARESTVHHRLKELEAFDQLREQHAVATGRDLSRPDGSETEPHDEPDMPRPPATEVPTPDTSSPVVTSEESHATTDDVSRPVATGRDVSRHEERAFQAQVAALNEQQRELYDRLLATYKEQIDGLKQDKDELQKDKRALLEQLTTKDKQIDRFFASERDTKTLFGSLQTLMNSIWPSNGKKEGETFVPMRDALDSGLNRENRDDRP